MTYITLSFRQDYASSPYPDDTLTEKTESFNFQLQSKDGDYDYKTGSLDFKPFAMTLATGTGVGQWPRHTFSFNGSPNQRSWVKTWVSPIIGNTSITLSPSNTSFSFQMSSAMDSAYGYAPTWEISIYVYRTSTDAYYKLYENTSSIPIDIYWSIPPFYNWTNSAITETVTASHGDKLCIDTRMFFAITPPIPIGFNIYFDGSYSADYPANSHFTINSNLWFPIPVSNKREMKYNVLKPCDRTPLSSFDILGLVGSSFKTIYRNKRASTLFYDFETASPLRGRRSLMINPDVNFPTVSSDVQEYIQSNGFKQNKCGDGMASFHRFIMLEDYEGVENRSDLGTDAAVDLSDFNRLPFALIAQTPTGTSVFDITHAEDTPPYTVFEYAFLSSTDLSRMNILSFLGNSNIPTTLEVYTKDADGNQSYPQTIYMNNHFGRYETELNMDGIDVTKVTSVGFITRYAGKVTVDDIAILSSNEAYERYDWLTVNMTKYGYNRQGKTNTIKIPYGGGEIVQNFGEYNAKGDMMIRTFNNSDIIFLNAVENEKIPLYARFKNTGLPIYINNHSVIQKNYVSRSVQSQISINFTEIYDKRR